MLPRDLSKIKWEGAENKMITALRHREQVRETLRG